MRSSRRQSQDELESGNSESDRSREPRRASHWELIFGDADRKLTSDMARSRKTDGTQLRARNNRPATPELYGR